jgi:hypothetical protein
MEQRDVHGLDVFIETSLGAERSGTAPDGSPWTVTMPADYGFIRKTNGADGEAVDCYVGPDADTERVWIVYQNDVATGEFDEHKVMLGFPDRAAALVTYVAGFSDGRGAERIGKIQPTTIAGLKRALAEDEFRADSAGTAELTDYQTAEAIRDGDLPSPTKYGNFWLFDMRVTGTGAAYRDALGEYTIRDPEEWTSPEFVERCNGLPVIDRHPPPGGGLDSEEWRERAIGTIVLPYVKGKEVWGIAKIFDEDAATLMQTTHRTTSPGVTTPKGANPVTLNDGTKVLAEPLPRILDHLAICQAGVWDQDGPPSGIRLDARKEQPVPEAEDLEKEKQRADSAEAERDDAKTRADAAAAEVEKLKADAKRRDDEAEEERKKFDRRRRADRRARHDRSKHDGEDYMDCSRCDSEEKSEEEELEKGDKKRHDEGARTADVDPDKQTHIHDAKQTKETIASMQATIDALVAKDRARDASPSIEDANALSAAFKRYDALYQMLGEPMLSAYPGEKPTDYRRRLANGLRKYTKTFVDYQFHDALDPQAFGLIEESILKEATVTAKHVEIPATGYGQLREVRGKNELDKDETRFYGDCREAFRPFMHPQRTYIKAFNLTPAGSR